VVISRVGFVREIDPREEKRAVDLGVTPGECEFLLAGVREWGGPATPNDGVARLCGFSNPAAMDSGLKAIDAALAEQRPLRRKDWRRALIATEIVFASDTYGAGVEWQIVTGRDDCESLVTLRELQRKLVGVSPRFDSLPG